MKDNLGGDKDKKGSKGSKGKGGANGQSNAGMIDDNFLRLYFEQMVEAVGTIHELKIVHSDLKPANFLFVEGALKLIDEINMKLSLKIAERLAELSE